MNNRLEEVTGHSPLGFSGAERWANCPGSVALIASLPDTEEADPEYRRAGVAAHAAWAHCLQDGLDAWEAADRLWEGYDLTADDLRAGQYYLDFARARIEAMPGVHRSSVAVWIERQIHAPEIHEHAYGTLDLALIAGNYAEVTDYKHGEGMYVEVEGNWQLMGYAALLLSKWPNIERFRLRIVQPRLDGAPPVREWEISTGELIEWRDRELIPAMNKADGGIKGLKPGPWCRFCRAKEALACPAIEHNALVVQEAAPVVHMISDERLGDLYARIEPLRIMAKAVEAEVLRRRLAGVDVPGSKTVLKKTFRVWKSTAKEAICAVLGVEQAMTSPELKGPADIEKLGPAARELVREYAYSPDAGYSVAPLSDRRKAVTVQKPSETFDFVTKSLDADALSE